MLENIDDKLLCFGLAWPCISLLERSFFHVQHTAAMDSEDELLLDALQLAELHRMREERAGPRSGNHPILKQRHEKGQFHTLYAELRQDEAKFKGFTRMKIATFDALLEILRTKYVFTMSHEFVQFQPVFRITRNSMREPIAPEQRLLVTLKFLATGVSMRTLAYDFFLGDTTVREIVHSTCNAVVELMKDTYIRTPNTADEWREISEGFWDRWNLPNTLGKRFACTIQTTKHWSLCDSVCANVGLVGAVDGKHVHLRAPANSGSLFFNYKGRFSTIMMAVADYRCRIVYLSVGSYGHEGDAGIFDRSDFGRALVDDANPLHLPDDSPLPGTDVMSSFFFVGDNAFPIHKRMMKPFTLRNMTRPKRIFNYRYDFLHSVF